MKTNDLFYVKSPSIIEHFYANVTHDKRVVFVGDYLRFLKDSHLFLIDKNITPVSNEATDIAMPFSLCFFEAAPGVSLHPTLNIKALLAAELSPNRLAGYFFDEAGGNVHVFDVGDLSFFDAMPTKERDAGTTVGKDILQRICGYIRTCNLGQERIFRTVNLKTRTQGKCLHKIENVIRLKPILHKSYPEPAFSREIDWDMRWWVRGHWRKLPSPEVPGKDRTGEYNVKGFTWVTEHLRGPENKPIRNSTYILGDTNATERHQTV